MPYRAMNVALGVVGVAVLIALVVLGVNVYRSARTGPHWKRTLIIAGLVMLGLVGTTSPIACCYMPVVAYQPYHGQDLESVSVQPGFPGQAGCQAGNPARRGKKHT